MPGLTLVSHIRAVTVWRRSDRGSAGRWRLAPVVPGGEPGGVCCQFMFKRQLVYPFLSSYVPCILLVMASFSPYFMSIHSTPDRINVGITVLQAVLGVFTQVSDSPGPKAFIAFRHETV